MYTYTYDMAYLKGVLYTVGWRQWPASAATSQQKDIEAANKGGRADGRPDGRADGRSLAAKCKVDVQI